MSSCTSCGERLASKWKYCIFCGATLGRSAIDQLADLTGGIAAEPHATAASRVAAAAILAVLGITALAITIVYFLQLHQ